MIGLKQNYPVLYRDTKDYFNELSADSPTKTTFDKRHGRIEKREYQLMTDMSWFKQKNELEGLKGLRRVKSTIIEKDKTCKFTRYFITSLTELDEFADSVKKHLTIENQLHWYLDVIFCEDASLVLNIFRKIKLNLVSQA